MRNYGFGHGKNLAKSVVDCVVVEVEFGWLQGRLN